jgi:GNAT superfamily N-acetyltransferase
MDKELFAIVPVSAEYLEELTQVTIKSKRYWNYPEGWMEIWMPNLTITSEYIASNETWMAVVDYKPVAYYSLKQNGEDLWLDNLWVLPEFSGQGIGRNLIEHAMERARIREFASLKIEADPNAASFYEKMGARKIGEHHSEVDGQPRVLPVMEINL